MVKKVSLKDIAQRVGVSTALVSYVLSGNQEKGRVGKATAEKIRQAAQELNYQPNHIAKSLKTGKTNTIGLIVADISNPFFASIARGVEDESSRSGLTTIIGSSDESAEKLKKLVDVFVKRQVDGFIVSPAEHSEDTISYILSLGIPICLIDRHFEQVKASYVVTDNRESMRNAVSHLVQGGYKNIAFISYQSNLQHMRDREQGFLEASRDIRSTVFKIHYTKQHTELRSTIGQLLKAKEVDAIVFATNTLSVAGLKYLRQQDVQIPEDLNVSCFDSSEVYDFFQHPITHVRQPIDQLAKESVKILVEQINQSGHEIEGCVLSSELVCGLN
ncbi:MAG: LacI family DNA-binding transcriptional regulator [Sphingobacterium sp.]